MHADEALAADRVAVAGCGAPSGSERRRCPARRAPARRRARPRPARRGRRARCPARWPTQLRRRRRLLADDDARASTARPRGSPARRTTRSSRSPARRSSSTGQAIAVLSAFDAIWALSDRGTLFRIEDGGIAEQIDLEARQALQPVVRRRVDVGDRRRQRRGHPHRPEDATRSPRRSRSATAGGHGVRRDRAYVINHRDRTLVVIDTRTNEPRKLATIGGKDVAAPERMALLGRQPVDHRPRHGPPQGRPADREDAQDRRDRRQRHRRRRRRRRAVGAGAQRGDRPVRLPDDGGAAQGQPDGEGDDGQRAARPRRRPRPDRRRHRRLAGRQHRRNRVSRRR